MNLITMTTRILAGAPLLLMICALCSAPASAQPIDQPQNATETWCSYLEYRFSHAPHALARGYSIINQLELQDYDVAPLQSTCAHAKHNHCMGKGAYQNGLYTIPDNPCIFRCKADCCTLTGQIAGLVGSSHPHTRGMVRVAAYCFPGFADFIGTTEIHPTSPSLFPPGAASAIRRVQIS
jgi:hypothetical protein